MPLSGAARAGAASERSSEEGGQVAQAAGGTSPSFANPGLRDVVVLMYGRDRYLTWACREADGTCAATLTGRTFAILDKSQACRYRRHGHIDIKSVSVGQHQEVSSR
jgi:hypothetical protein